MNIGAGIGIGFQELFSKAFRYDTTIACQNGSDVTPVIKLPGGTFSATPAGLSLNSTTGVIDVSASTVGTYTVTYSIGPTEDTITIQAPDDASFSYSSTSFRQNASNPAPTITGLAGGVFSGPTGIIFADSGTNTNSSSGIINLAASTVGGPYTITYTTTGNCPTSRNFDVTIQVALSITYSATSFCEDGGNTAAPTVVGDPGSGTFASTTGLTINSTTGVINTDTSTPDENTPYTVTYTASTGETATTQVTIKNLPTIVITPNPSLSVCDGSSATLTASGGASYLWSTGATSAQITVSSSGTYSVTGTGSNGCQNTASAAFTVNPLPTISISASSTSICAGDSVTLTASGAGAGGSYSWSDGQTTAAITVTPGATITYSVTGTDANGCFNTASQQITVTAVDTATVVYDSNSYCQVPTGALAVEGYYPLYTTESASNAESSDGTSHTHVLSGTTYYMPNAGIVMYHGTYSLTATPTITGASGTFNSPTGLSINTTTGVIDKNASTPGTYSVVYTTSGSCSITVTNSITITALDNATFAYGSSAYCDNVSDPTPTKSATGTFSSSTGLSINTSTGEVDLDASTAGTYVIGFVTNGSCPNSSIQTLTINAAPTVAISGTLSYCAGSNTTLTATAGLSSYLWSSGETTQSITATAGSYTVTGTDANGCSTTSSSVTVTETPLDNAGFSYSASSYEPTDPDPTPTITGLTGGTFSAGSGLVFVDSGTNTGSSTGQIDLSASTATSYTITYNTSSSGSSVCPNTSTQTVEIGAPVEQIANAEAMSFDGIDQYINVGDSDNFSFGNGATDSPFSVSAWANIDSLSNFTILTKGVYSSTGEWHVRMTGSNQMHLVLYDGTAYQACIINETLNTGQWYHFVFTYDGRGQTSANQGIIGYLNGSVATLSRVSSGTYQAMTNTVSPLYIAKNSNNYSNGKLDEVAIFNTALSASKIQQIYDATAVVDGIPQTANLFTGGLDSSLVYWNRMGDS